MTAPIAPKTVRRILTLRTKGLAFGEVAEQAGVVERTARTYYRRWRFELGGFRERDLFPPAARVPLDTGVLATPSRGDSHRVSRNKRAAGARPVKRLSSRKAS